MVEAFLFSITGRLLPPDVAESSIRRTYGNDEGSTKTRSSVDEGSANLEARRSV
jgi:hypothetical protein